MCGRDAVVNRMSFLPPPPFPQPSGFIFVNSVSQQTVVQRDGVLGCGYRGNLAVRMGWGCWGLFGTDAEAGKALPCPHPCPQTEITPLSSNQSLVKSTSEQTFFRQKNEWLGPTSSGFLPVGFLADVITPWLAGSGSGCGWGRRGSQRPVQQSQNMYRVTQWHRTKNFEPKILNELVLIFQVISWVLVASYREERIGVSLSSVHFFHFIDYTKYLLLNIWAIVSYLELQFK